MTRILAYRFSAFGDIAMTVPVFRELLEQNPDLEIIMVTRKNFEDLFSDLPQVIFKGIDLEDYKGIRGMRRLSRELLKEFKFDYVADLHDVIRSKILDTFFANRNFKVFKIDKGKVEKENLTDIWNLNKMQLKTTFERYTDVFREMGFSVKLSNKYREKTSEKKAVGFAPFAQHKGKMLPLEKSFEICKILAKTHRIYLFGGGSEEKAILENWQTEIPNTENIAGKLSLDQELNLISTLQLMISMDSANMHLASLVGTRCVSVWGSTHPFAGFLGYGQSYEDVVQVEDLTCRPCSTFGDKECFRGDYACLNEFDIQKIIDKI
ncbi:MAG: glycosyltransferase family 9 protein [Chryseobacterium sp.]|nr:glycosyltransferase family 9 protein [Chryseobacterium sp.]